MAQARHLLSTHHGGGGDSSTQNHLDMARGRWGQDSEGWRSRQARNQSRGNEPTRRQLQDSADKQREEIKKLQQQLRDARGQHKRAEGGDDVGPHPTAREGPARHGDWECVHCHFKTNRYSREQCYRCAVSKTFSFPQRTAAVAAPAVSYSAVASGIGATPISLSAATSPTSTTSSSTSSSSPSSAIAGLPAVSPPPPAAAQPPISNPSVPPSPMQSNGVTGPGLPAIVGPEGIKTLKGHLEKLTAARAHLASDPLLGHLAAGLEQQIQAVRNQLSSAQPLEVALRGTLGAVATARQSLARAEQKAAKLEAQVVSAVSAYESAAMEVQTCRKTLADAEAETARTAGGRFNPRLLIGAHPGAALAVLSEAAAARCVVGAAGVDASLAARVNAAFQEVQAVCRLLPADVPVPTPPTGPGAGVATAAAGAMEPSEARCGEAASGGFAGTPQGTASSDGSNAELGATSAQAVAAAQQQVQQHLFHQQQQEQLQQQHFQQQQILQQQIQQQALADQQLFAQQQAAQLQAQSAAAELAQQHAQAALAQAAQQAAVQAAAATAAAAAAPAELPSPPPAAPPSAVAGDGQELEPPAEGDPAKLPGQGGAEAAHAVSVPVPPRDDADLGGGKSDEANGTHGRRDDSMGGGAAEGVANKRSAAEAVETARAIAAKTKARACGSFRDISLPTVDDCVSTVLYGIIAFHYKDIASPQVIDAHGVISRGLHGPRPDARSWIRCAAWISVPMGRAGCRSVRPPEFGRGCPHAQMHRPLDAALRGRGCVARNRHAVAPRPARKARATGSRDMDFGSLQMSPRWCYGPMRNRGELSLSVIRLLTDLPHHHANRRHSGGTKVPMVNGRFADATASNSFAAESEPSEIRQYQSTIPCDKVDAQCPFPRQAVRHHREYIAAAGPTRSKFWLPNSMLLRNLASMLGQSRGTYTLLSLLTPPSRRQFLSSFYKAYTLQSLLAESAYCNLKCRRHGGPDDAALAIVRIRFVVNSAQLWPGRARFTALPTPS